MCKSCGTHFDEDSQGQGNLLEDVRLHSDPNLQLSEEITPSPGDSGTSLSASFLCRQRGLGGCAGCS